jgi:hypothetical protein
MFRNWKFSDSTSNVQPVTYNMQNHLDRIIYCSSLILSIKHELSLSPLLFSPNASLS